MNKTSILGLFSILVVGAAQVSRAEGPDPLVSAGVKACQEQGYSAEECTQGLKYENSPGKAVFRQHCAVCHEQGVAGAPARYMLGLMSARSIYLALSSGVMQAQGARLGDEERSQVAEYLTHSGLDSVQHHPPLRCKNDANWFDSREPSVGTGWGIDPQNARRIPVTQAGLSASELGRLKVRWVFAYPGASRIAAQPLISNGALFVGSQEGVVYALDAKSGCVHWTFKAAAQVKGSLVIRGQTLWFGDTLAHAFALDAITGHVIWDVRVDDHPAATITGTPVWYKGRVYVPVASHEEGFARPNYSCCSFRGSIVALDAATGRLLWKRYAIPAPAVEQYRSTLGKPQFGPSGAGIWSTPLVDAKRGNLYFTTGNNYSRPSDENSDAIFAIDLETGEIRWRTQTLREDTFNHWSIICQVGTPEPQPDCPGPMKAGPDADFTAPPVLVHDRMKGDILIAARKDGAVFGVDPSDGKIVWRVQSDKVKPALFGVMAVGTTVIVPNAGATDVQPGYPSKSVGGGLYALNAFSGKILWDATAPRRCANDRPCEGASTAPIGFADLAFVGSPDGYVRAYDTVTGKIRWELPTARKYTTLNGDIEAGSSLSMGNIMVAHGVLYVISGSVLLAFSAS